MVIKPYAAEISLELIRAIRRVFLLPAWLSSTLALSKGKTVTPINKEFAPADRNALLHKAIPRTRRRAHTEQFSLAFGTSASHWPVRGSLRLRRAQSQQAEVAVNERLAGIRRRRTFSGEACGVHTLITCSSEQGLQTGTRELEEMGMKFSQSLLTLRRNAIHYNSRLIHHASALLDLDDRLLDHKSNK
ncbi:Cytosolic carboxypeptidase 1 [Labeo rohita]|uniref:Cytosolic carboxypeptidase 1 n=1 Tax=Labeo rohita TaxID=84645 RepID=A0ABQ8LD92_LABRO|nr:Cytosolic carboxypeptidase 1 [Labeo rohita]